MNIFKHIKYRLLHVYENTQYKIQRAKKGYGYRDLWNVDDWFLEIMSRMLQEYKESKISCPMFIFKEYCEKHNLNFETYMSVPANETIKQIQQSMDKECEKTWDDILDKMIALFLDSRRDTCSKTNKYQEEYDKASDEFIDKWGFLGEGLRTEEEIQQEKEFGYFTYHAMSELPEYESISKKFMAEEQKLDKYCEKCRKEAYTMFIKYGSHIIC